MSNLVTALASLGKSNPELASLVLGEMGKNRIYTHAPYPWQREFHVAGKDNFERLLMAANGVGKTLTGGYETALHLLGDYPEPGQVRYGEHHPAVVCGWVHADDDVWPGGWTGRRWEEPVLFWIGSISNGTQKEYTQPILLGKDLAESLGTGFLPKDRIILTATGKIATRQAGISGVAEEVGVRHKSGGKSLGVFKTYEQGWRMWQGAAPDGVWMDEQPDDNAANESGIFAEAQTRVLRTNGEIFMTLTPLLGETATITHFTEPETKGIYFQNCGWEDAPHLNAERKEALLKSYPQHQRDARTKGIPMLGRGAVFPILESDIVCDPIPIPAHWPQICGIDFGYGHPFGWARLAWDRMTDTVYVTDCFGVKGEIPDLHVASIKRRCPAWVPHSWPHDGLNTEKSGGKILIHSYQNQGVNFLSRQAHYPPPPGEKPKMGAQDQWVVIEHILERMHTGRWKVFSTCQPWLKEYRSYHTKISGDGKLRIVALRDDVLKASFYAHMMLRFACTQTATLPRRRHQTAGVSAAL